MGRPKQLLPIGNRPLLRRVVEAAIEFGAVPTVVVLGSHAEEIKPVVTGLPVVLVVNDGWQEGMGSSIRVGVQAVLKIAPKTAGIVIALGDQPDFSAIHLHHLVARHLETGHSIVASSHVGGLMPPVFFSADHFPALASLQGDAGAKELLQRKAEEVAAVNMEDPADLDTPADYADYLARRGDRLSET